jgi:cbb3-type cytochrome oxidase maturation protein
MWTIPLLIVISISVGIGAWLFFLWAVGSGQFEDIEGPKHRMLEDDEEDEPGAKKDTRTPGSDEKAESPDDPDE